MVENSVALRRMARVAIVEWRTILCCSLRTDWERASRVQGQRVHRRRSDWGRVCVRAACEYMCAVVALVSGLRRACLVCGLYVGVSDRTVDRVAGRCGVHCRASARSLSGRYFCPSARRATISQFVVVFSAFASGRVSGHMASRVARSHVRVLGVRVRVPRAGSSARARGARC